MSSDDNQCEVDLDHEHFLKTIGSFWFYGHHLLKRVDRALTYQRGLSENQRLLIAEFEENLDEVRSCIVKNNKLINKLIEHSAPDIFNGEHGSKMHALMQSSLPNNSTQNGDKRSIDAAKLGPFAYTTSDMDKVRSTLKQFARDWSSVGERERESCYLPIITTVCDLYEKPDVNLKDIHILVPGAGLGRLAWELAHRGFTCQGNEWSLHMLIPAYFILNNCKVVNEHTLYPWVSQFCNNWSRKDQLAPIRFPDVNPSDLPDGSEFSMAAGDFNEIYTEPDSWDCIATVFFIDTAHNILDYLQTIWRILKPGGYWINLGPLLYHFSDVPGQDSLELSFEELQLAISRIGFETVKETRDIQSGYTQNPASMLSYNYTCVYSLFRKTITS